MITSGQVGHHTPTIENSEKIGGRCSRIEDVWDGLLNNTSRLRIPQADDVLDHPSAIASNANSLAEPLLERLEWRERLRHFTWTFFTMTMATGGIANRLYEGLCGMADRP